MRFKVDERLSSSATCVHRDGHHCANHLGGGIECPYNAKTDEHCPMHRHRRWNEDREQFE